MSASETCKTCEGNKHLRYLGRDNSEEVINCPDCNGEGWRIGVGGVGGTLTCSDCNGTGTVERIAPTQSAATPLRALADAPCSTALIL